MKDFKLTGETRLAVEKGIHLYFESRRKKVDAFIGNHFSWEESFRLQKKFLLVDLIRYPINAAWAIPYLGLRKFVETFEKVGWRKWVPVMQTLPSGIRTNYQRQIEKFILTELLEVSRTSDGEARDELHQTIIKQLPENLKNQINCDELFRYRKHLNAQLEKYSASRSLISDLAGTVATMLIGWIGFGNHSMSISSIGNKIARQMARDKASSQFFLGRNLGNTYYNLFPPSPTNTQVVIATLAVGAALTLVSLITTAFSDPVRKKLGLQQANLLEFIDQLEDCVLLELSRQSKAQSLFEISDRSA